MYFIAATYNIYN